MPEETKSAEAVCFTAGPEGAAFAAGVIHAWLAADRPEPRVVAGISTGSITAAAMQQSMLRRTDGKGIRTEATRWQWFQSYLADILNRPLDVIWKAIPDPVDFFSASAPVQDLSCPGPLKDDERQSRYHFWMLTKIGKWLSSLPITIGDVGELAILKVRHDEQIPVPFIGNKFPATLWRAFSYFAQAVYVGLKLLSAVIATPSFTRTLTRFTADETGKSAKDIGIGIRPLFGWKIWIYSLALGVVLVVPFASLLWAVYLLLTSPHHYVGIAWLIGTAFYVLGLALAVVALLRKKPFAKKLAALAEYIDPNNAKPSTKKPGNDFVLGALKSADIETHVISNYHLKRALWRRFVDPGKEEPTINSDPSRTNLLIVACVLQTNQGNQQQCWADKSNGIVTALSAANTVQPLFPPKRVPANEAHKWPPNEEQDIDLVDGAVIRKNPLPALFSWLHKEGNQQIANDLEASSSVTSPNIHVIYHVPIEPFDANAGKPSPASIDLIESAQVGILMRARRDTSIEVTQTNYLSSVIAAQKLVGHQDPNFFALFAGEIAPIAELKFQNQLSPTRDEGLQATAEGCRRTLGRLYQDQIRANAAPDSGDMPCSSLIRKIAPSRSISNNAAPGLPEVCSQCTARLVAYPPPPVIPSKVFADFGQPASAIATSGKKPVELAVPNLCTGTKPKITFVASGGVFSGAFHIGLIGAMQALNITPDLVMGASVGTLIGGAMAAIRNYSEPQQQLAALANLTNTFLEVDKTVALTVPLKTAVKRLGLRSHRLDLSPAALRDAVTAGTSKDVGYASTGVPPLVIDTLSQLFIIPPTETLSVGSDFLAGRFTKAAARFIALLRKNTLSSLDIRYGVIGTSMLEPAARSLLGDGVFNLDQHQPYLTQKGGTAIFCTTAWVNQRWPLVLGRDALVPGATNFRFLYAALSSSAFPAAFAPRQDAEVFPGSGLVSNLFCDGGTFDNLPFIPAIEILSEAQRVRFARSGSTPGEFLAKSLDAPDLIISAGFDPLPITDHRNRFATIADVSARSKSLSADVKTQGFVEMCQKLAQELRVLNEAPDDPRVACIKTGSIVAGVVNVVPSTELHVNPAFAFSRSVGLQPARVAASIANGCFQTLRGLYEGKHQLDSETHRSLTALGIHVELGSGKSTSHDACPYFQVICPFSLAHSKGVDATTAAKTVFNSCCSDPVHQKLYQIELPKEQPIAPELCAVAAVA